MVSSMSAIDQASSQNLEHAATVFSAAQEQLASMQEITGAIASLSDLVKELQDIVKEFKI